MIKAVTSFSIFLFLIYSCNKNTPQFADYSVSAAVDSTYYSGDWSGDLYYSDYHLPFGFHIDSEKHTIDNPAQSLVGVSADSVKYNPDWLTLYAGKVRFELHPERADEISAKLIDGTDIQTFSIFKNREMSPLSRPQLPKYSSDYLIDTVNFTNNIANISLAGTLTLPKDDPGSIAILLTGSGPQDRDETILGHKPFAVIADFLTHSGVGVLRYDDRGMGASEGAHNAATSFNFAQDAAAAYQFIQSKYPNTPTGFIGHSEGGMIAQIADSLVGGASFHIYLASPGMDITELMREQNELILEKMMSPEGLKTYISGLLPIYETIIANTPLNEKQSRLNDLTKALYHSLDKEDAQKIAPSDLVFSMSFSQLLYLKWWPYFLSYQPSQYLSQITCPILALNGEKDIQVSPRNLEAIKKAAYQSLVSTITLTDTNHLFQGCHSCTIGEYGLLTETFSPDALEIIRTWLGANEFIR